MKKYRVLVDAVIEGQTFLKDAEIPNGHSLTVIPDLRAQPYIDAGLIEEIEVEDGEVDPTMLPNPPQGSSQPPIVPGANTSGVINPRDHNKEYLLDLAGKTPNAVFDPSMTKAQLADAINTAVATNAADAARGGGGAA